MVWVNVLVLMTGSVRPGPAQSPGRAAAPCRATVSGETADRLAGSGEKADRIVAGTLRLSREKVVRDQPTPRPVRPPMSTYASARRPRCGKPKSPFLASPDSSPDDRYGPDGAVDWSDVPPWRQTSFFGIRARGLFFVYVVDCSGSMIDDDRMPRATIELRRSVFALREPQRFEVIFYNSESIPMPGGPIPRSATLQAKNQLRSFLQLIDPDGGTDPRPAMKQALSLRPDAVFLLSDGAFPDGTVAELTRLNKHKVPIHCVDLTGGLAGDHLKRIAAANGGQYASRMGDLQGRPLRR